VKKRGLRGIAALALGAAAVSGCQGILGIEELPGATSGADLADSSAGTGGSAQGSSGTAGSSSGGTANLGSGGTLDSGGTLGSGGTGAASGSAGSQDSGLSCSPGADAGARGPWWQQIRTPMCTSEGVPSAADRPECDEGGSSSSPIYLMIFKLRFGTANDDDPTYKLSETAWRNIGFDLDKRCTNSTSCEDLNQEPILERSCQFPSTQIPYDGVGCRDNELGKLFLFSAKSPYIGGWFGLTEADYNCELFRGGFGIMLKLSGYNGKANDPTVRLDVYTTLGLQTPPDWFCRESMKSALELGWEQKHAPWLANEPWKIAASSISLSAPDAGNELPDSKVYDGAAFVRNGYFFARLPDNAELWLNGEHTTIPGFRMFLHRGILTGELIKQQDGTWTVDKGTLGGAVRPDQLLESFQAIGACKNLCRAFDEVRDYLNTYRDTLVATSDNSPNTPCDGLSFGADFEARQAAASLRDIEPATPPTLCPKPRHPDAPPQGCVCPVGGGACVLPDGGS
jgi:hypothetical protein